ncbi:MAG: helix-turn-helix transcriptional regulator [Bacteroidales bacterium]|nr:helix-turn-helix transcriptional regulator [Bacteroidales bacterium]
MKDRIAHIMRAKNLKASDFAALLGIQPSAISHILSGRNQPSLDFVKRIKETFPEYNLDWIVFGTGPMTLSEPSRDSFQEALKEVRQVPLPDTLPLFTDQIITEPEDPTPSDAHISGIQGLNPDSAVKVMYVLYEDGTFDTFIPR